MSVGEATGLADRAWMKYEERLDDSGRVVEVLWSCTQCGTPCNLTDTECVGCGAEFRIG